MPRLIDADALKDIMCASVCGLVQPLLCTCGCAQILAVDNAPTIEAEPVRHGHWEGIEYGLYADGNPVYDVWQCSECAYEIEGDADELTRYCPNCGAKMDEVDK